MDRYVRRDLNPPGIRVATHEDTPCGRCSFSWSGMADGLAGARICGYGGERVPVREDFSCDVASEGEQDE